MQQRRSTSTHAQVVEHGLEHLRVLMILHAALSCLQKDEAFQLGGFHEIQHQRNNSGPLVCKKWSIAFKRGAEAQHGCAQIIGG